MSGIVLSFIGGPSGGIVVVDTGTLSGGPFISTAFGG